MNFFKHKTIFSNICMQSLGYLKVFIKKYEFRVHSGGVVTRLRLCGECFMFSFFFSPQNVSL